MTKMRIRASGLPAAAVVAACAVAGAGMAVVGHGTAGFGPGSRSGSGPGSGSGSGSGPTARRLLPAGTPPARATVRADGTAVACPSGAVPEVSLQGADFRPRLLAGTRFGPGRYRIRIDGQVQNDSTEPITVDRVLLTVNGHPWTAQVRTVSTVPAGSGAALVVEGTFPSSGDQPAALAAQLSWHWQAPQLRACGEHGLDRED